MSYQGERARPLASESGRFFAVSKIRIDAHGLVSDVLWCEVDGKSDRDVGEPVEVPVSDVVDAIHDGAQVGALFDRSGGFPTERSFVVLEHPDGRETVALEAPAAPGRSLSDMERLDP